jgi:hypothetical protein
MERQGSFSQAKYAGKKKQTLRDGFWAEMKKWCRVRGWWNGCGPVRATIIASPSRPRTKSKTRDPEAHQIKKG